MRGTRVVWSAIVLMSALSPAGAAQSAGGAAGGARFAQSPQYPLLPRALEIDLALSAAPKHLRDEATVSCPRQERIRNREEGRQRLRVRGQPPRRRSVPGVLGRGRDPIAPAARRRGRAAATVGKVGRGAFVFMNRVGPDGMMIVPIGQKERDAIVSDAQSLIAQVEQAIGYQPSR